MQLQTQEQPAANIKFIKNSILNAESMQHDDMQNIKKNRLAKNRKANK